MRSSLLKQLVTVSLVIFQLTPTFAQTPAALVPVPVATPQDLAAVEARLRLYENAIEKFVENSPKYFFVGSYFDTREYFGDVPSDSDIYALTASLRKIFPNPNRDIRIQAILRPLSREQFTEYQKAKQFFDVVLTEYSNLRRAQIESIVLTYRDQPEEVSRQVKAILEHVNSLTLSKDSLGTKIGKGVVNTAKVMGLLAATVAVGVADTFAYYIGATMTASGIWMVLGVPILLIAVGLTQHTFLLGRMTLKQFMAYRHDNEASKPFLESVNRSYRTFIEETKNLPELSIQLR